MEGFLAWRDEPEVKQAFRIISTKYSKEYDSQQVEYSDFVPGNDYFIFLYSYDDPVSLTRANQWNKVVKEFSALKDIVFGHVEMTSAFFDGTWPYWTPLIRFYKQSNLGWFDYYYDEVTVKTLGEFIEKNSESFKFNSQKIVYNYTTKV